MSERPDGLERLVVLAQGGDLIAADRLAAAVRRGAALGRGADDPRASHALDVVGDALLVVLALQHRRATATDEPLSPTSLERAGESWVALDFPVARAVVSVDTAEARRNAPGHAGSPSVWRDALRWLATAEGAPFLERMAETAAVHDPADVVTAGAMGDGSWPLAALSLATAVWVARDTHGPWLADGGIVSAHKSARERPHWRLDFAGGLFALATGERRLTSAERYLALRELGAPG